MTRVNRRFIFVGGLHRSGTTLLADMISSSPNASGLEHTGVRMDEGQFLQDVYPTGRELGGVTKWALDPRAHMTELDAERDLNKADRLWASWSKHWQLDADYLVEKTPLNLMRTRYLQHLFPQSSFVIITRHPITQALTIRKWSSTMTGKLGIGFPRLIEHWLRAHEVFISDVPRLRRVHVVRFEHLLNQPERTIRELQEFLGYAIESRIKDQLDNSRSAQYANEWNEEVERKGLFRAIRSIPRASFQSRGNLRDSLARVSGNLLFPRYARLIQDLYGDRIASLGYDLGTLDDATPWRN